MKRTTQEIVDSLKVNLATYEWMPKDMQEFISGKDCLILRIDGGWTDGLCHMAFRVVYRLPEDFTLPIEAEEGRRLVTEKEMKKYPKPATYRHMCVKLDNPQWDDSCGGESGVWRSDIIYSVPSCFEFEPEKKEDHFIECPISNEAGKYYRLIPPPVWDELDNIPIHELSSVVGFAGIQFEGQNSDEWYMELAAFIGTEGDDKGYISWVSCEFYKPATPIRARFIVNGGSK